MNCFSFFFSSKKAAYADLTPYMLMTIPSIDDLNNKLQNPVGVRNFRPNLVLRNCQPYEEVSLTVT